MKHKLAFTLAALLTSVSFNAAAAPQPNMPVKVTTAEDALGSFKDFSVGDTNITADEQGLVSASAGTDPDDSRQCSC